MKEKRPSILEANYLFMIVAFLLITVGGYFQHREIYSGMFITQYILIFAPMVLLVGFKKYSFKTVFRLNKITLNQIILAILIIICSYPIALFFNYIMIVIISIFGEIQQSPLPIPENTAMFLKSLFLFAITPGICEEVMFRGVMFSAYEKMGAKKAILITALLFGVFHFNIQNFLAPTFLGILIAYMVYKTNSIYTGVIAHATNNVIALVLLKSVGNQNIDTQAITTVGQTQVLLLGLISIGVISIFAILIVYNLIKLLNKASEKSNIDNLDYIKKEKIGILHIIPIIIIITIFIYSVFRYFQYI